MKRKGEREPAVEGPPYIIGWKEFLDFPEWGVRQVKAKMDTGARSSAVHVSGYRLYESEERVLMAELRMPLRRHRPEQITVVHAPVLKTVAVTDSGGHCETRPVFETLIRLGPVTKRVRFTVTNRAGLLFRVLLGRKALEGDFVVDVSQKYRMKRKKEAAGGRRQSEPEGRG